MISMVAAMQMAHLKNVDDTKEDKYHQDRKKKALSHKN